MDKPPLGSQASLGVPWGFSGGSLWFLGPGVPLGSLETPGVPWVSSTQAGRSVGGNTTTIRCQAENQIFHYILGISGDFACFLKHFEICSNIFKHRQNMNLFAQMDVKTCSSGRSHPAYPRINLEKFIFGAWGPLL